MDAVATPWQDSALCRDVDPEIFFPFGKTSARKAQQVCQVCPVRNDCLSYALEHESHGVWGGLSESERGRLARS